MSWVADGADSSTGRAPSGAPEPSAYDYDGLERYVEGLFAPEDDALASIRKAADEAGLPRIQVPVATARVIQLLVFGSGARRVVEIGTLAGYSAVWIARALPAGGELISCEVNEKHAALARGSVESAGVADRVEIRVGDAMELLSGIASGTVDLVFLDADKERYVGYLEQSARLLRPGGMLLADNAFWRGEVLSPVPGQTSEHLARFNEALASDGRFEATILPVGDGLAVGVRV